MTPTEIVDELTFRSYRAQRQARPDIQPERWWAIYGDITALEARFRKERP